MTKTFLSLFVLASISMLAGCAGDGGPSGDVTADEERLQSEGAGAQDDRNRVCGRAAIKAVRQVEKVWTTPGKLVSAEFIDGFSDHEAYEVEVRYVDGDAARYVVNTESLGGDPCFVYGLQSLNDALSPSHPDFSGLVDEDGTFVSPDLTPGAAPSEDCEATARRAIEVIESAKFDAVTFGPAQLVTAFSDHELIRVPVTRDSSGFVEADTYLVNAESFGGAGCAIYGLQARGTQIPLTP